MKRIVLSIILICILRFSMAQQKNIPIQQFSAAEGSPIVLFISGDGGLNNFSSQLCQLLNKRGYEVLALNSKSYFWTKKSPEQLATDLSASLQASYPHPSRPSIFLVGYSFGADAVPFLVNKLSPYWHQKIQAIVLLEPSTSTDLEIHLSDMIGRSTTIRSRSVIEEINKIENIPTSIILGNETQDFPLQQIHLKHMKSQIIEGDHHFDGNAQKVLEAILTHFH